MIRTSLSGLARAEQMAEAKSLYEAIHPESKNGGAPGKAGGGKTKNATVAGFVRHIASETGLSPRTITYDVEIATGIVGTVRQRIGGTQLANSTRELIVIAKLPEPKQRSVVKTFEKDGLSGVRSVLRELVPKPDCNGASMAPVEYGVPLGEAVEVSIGRARCVVTLLNFVDGVGKFAVGPAMPKGKAESIEEPKPVEAFGEDTSASGGERPPEIPSRKGPRIDGDAPASDHIGSKAGLRARQASAPIGASSPTPRWTRCARAMRGLSQ